MSTFSWRSPFSFVRDFSIASFFFPSFFSFSVEVHSSLLILLLEVVVLLTLLLHTLLWHVPLSTLLASNTGTTFTSITVSRNSLAALLLLLDLLSFVYVNLVFLSSVLIICSWYLLEYKWFTAENTSLPKALANSRRIPRDKRSSRCIGGLSKERRVMSAASHLGPENMKCKIENFNLIGKQQDKN